MAKKPNSRWREAIDPSSQQLYYYHLDTNETRWERPEEMGPAPHATGWFGRGAAGSQASKYVVVAVVVVNVGSGGGGGGGWDCLGNAQ